MTQPGVAAPAAAPRDPAREAILEQLRYHQEMARASRNFGGGFVNGSDGAAWGNGVLHHANALAQYDAHQAAIRQGDSIGQLQQLAKLPPEAQALYLGGRGLDAGQIRDIQGIRGQGQSRINATNYADEAARNPDTSRAGQILDSESPIHEKAALFAAIPGIENPNSPHRKLWDAYMANQQATNPNLQHELGMYNPLDPKGSKVYDTSNPVGALQSIFGAVKDGIFGVDPAIPQRNRQFAADMGRLGYGRAQVGIQNPINTLYSRIGVQRPTEE